MFVVVVGAGRIGTRLVELALEDRHEVVVFEKDRARCENISQNYDVVAYNADATVERNLEMAEVESADAMVAATRDDPVNLMVMSLAQKLGIPHRVSVVNVHEAHPLFEARGATGYGNPSQIAADRLYSTLRRPGIVDYMPVGDGVEAVKVRVGAQSPLNGTSVMNAPLPHTILLAAVERNGHVTIPRGNTVLRKGDIVTLMVREDDLTDAVRLLQGVARDADDVSADPEGRVEADE